ncbi:MAG: methylated-DNA--[protein]-cysteine S-methyltransferase [Prevotellaceae bacterium]|jgi:methylated-DNA-[protein]-cysteine S-methyltransferase|nr:methylated-DNA--[protein]-cysteine S-methyltransferase [Prevotellaceae bacterium]
MLYSKILETPVGKMLAIADEEFLLLFDYVNSKHFETNRKIFGNNIFNFSNNIIDLLENELFLYFKQKLTQFSVPLKFNGTEFQRRVWQSLQQIPYGQTVSYLQQSEFLNVPRSVRAVAAACGRNKISIVAPCHRVIGSDGSMRGYAGGLEQKKLLLQLEKTIENS